jgi:hypothetical protein
MEQERALRDWDASHRLTVMGGTLWALQRQGRRLRYWGEAAQAPAELLGLDREHECAAVAIEAARRFGLWVVAGWVASDGHSTPTAHFWNTDRTGCVLDAAEARRNGIGWLGIEIGQDMSNFLRLRNPYPPVAARAA